MKRFIMLGFICLSLLSCVSYDPSSSITLEQFGFQKVSTDPNDTMYCMKDDFQKVTSYADSYFIKESSPIQVLLYQKYDKTEKGCSLRFYYQDKNWIFFDKALLVNSDGTVLQKVFDSTKIKRDVHSGYVTEDISLMQSDNDIKEMRDFLSKTPIKLRLTGKSLSDYILTSENINTILKTYDFYNSL